MPNLSAGPGLRLAVEVDHNAAFGEQLRNNLMSSSMRFSITQSECLAGEPSGKPYIAPDVLLELADGAAASVQ